MNNTLLTYYTTAFQSLNQGNTDYGPAPHKPILLLSIIDQLEQQKIITERVATDEQLKAQFQKNWNLLVNTGHRCDINNPLYHLQKEGFWRVVKTDGEPLDQARGISKIAYGLLDAALVELLAAAEYRAVLRMVILDRYFETTQASYLTQNPYPAFITAITEQVTESPQQQDTYREAWRLVTGYVRNHKFRIALMQAYNYTCCMSRLQTTPDIGIIEACHIRPHAISGNSHISNGIPLCRNLHRAFDSGVVSIDDKYQILMRPKNEFSESASLYGIRQLVGQGIVLPQEERFYPSLEALGWHREWFGF